MFISSTLFSQPKMDSLLISMKNLSTEDQIRKFTGLCWEYRSNNPEAAIKFGLRAIRLMGDNHHYTRPSETYNYLGVIYGNLGQLDSAFYYYNLAISAARDVDDSIQIAYSLNNIGDYYFKNALYSIALENIIDANEIFENLGDDRGVAYTLNDIGEIYLKQKDYEKALEYFLRSGAIRESNNDKRGLAKSYINQASVYVKKGFDNEALETYYKALYLSEEIKYVKGESWVLAGIGDIYYQQGHYEKALQNRIKALEIDLEIGNKYGELINYNQIGLIYFAQGNIKKSEEYYFKAHSKSAETGHLDQLMTSYNYLKNLYLKKNDYKNAFKYLNAYESLKDSIFSHENSNKIADLQTAFITERKERENELLKKNIEFEKSTSNYLLLISGLILIAGFFVISKYKSERKANRMLYELNTQKDKMFSIISHDLKNPAGAINNFLELMYLQYDELTDEEKKEFIKHSYNASDTLIELLLELLEWGHISRGLIEVEIKEFQLEEIVKDIFKLLGSNADQKNISLTYKDCNTVIYTDRIMINTVLRNFVNNAIKFTPKGGSVIISHYEDNKYNYISTKDTGIGISTEMITDIFRIDKSTSTPGTDDEPGTGLGLPICKEFVEKCSGKIRVETEMGKGSNFIVVLPKQSKV